MSIQVEFYGIPRVRAGVPGVTIEADRLDAAIAELARALPAFARECICDGRLRDGLSANLNGQRFVTDPATPLTVGDSLLILSADAGG